MLGRRDIVASMGVKEPGRVVKHTKYGMGPCYVGDTI